MSLLEKKLKSVGITDMRIMMITTAVTQPLPPFLVYVRGVEAIGTVVWAVIACTLLAVVIEGGKLFGS